jgi:hypothetical protein
MERGFLLPYKNPLQLVRQGFRLRRSRKTAKARLLITTKTADRGHQRK